MTTMVVEQIKPLFGTSIFHIRVRVPVLETMFPIEFPPKVSLEAASIWKEIQMELLIQI